MARPTSLQDLLAVRSLQHSGNQFDLERALLWPRSPLVAALTGLVPFVHSGAETFIAYGNGHLGRPMGMLQARLRRGRPECVICFIAPRLEVDDAAPIWYRLLNDLTQQVGEWGIQRIYVQVVNNGPGPEDVLRQAGMVTYAHEDLYRLQAPLRSRGRDKRLRRQRPRDSWNLLRLYMATTPRPVQQAEGIVVSDDNLPHGAGPTLVFSLRGEGVIYAFEEQGNLVGAVRLLRGLEASWMRLWLHPEAQTRPEEFLEAALSLLPSVPSGPVIVPVREYNSELAGRLEARGFEFLLKRSLMVKHTTVKVKEPVLKLVPAIEKTMPVTQAQVQSK